MRYRRLRQQAGREDPAAEPLHCTSLGLKRPAKRSAHHDQLTWDLFEKLCYR